MNITPYLSFNGQAEEAANFYADVLGGKVEYISRYESMPSVEGMEVPEDCKQLILHSTVTFPGGFINVADALPGDKRNFGKGCMLTIYCDSIAHAEEVYAKLIKNAQEVHCELCESFFAKLYAELTDQYGVLWSIYLGCECD